MTSTKRSPEMPLTTFS